MIFELYGCGELGEGRSGSDSVSLLSLQGGSELGLANAFQGKFSLLGLDLSFS